MDGSPRSPAPARRWPGRRGLLALVVVGVVVALAFVGGDGRVVGVLEMPPCRADPCPTYAPTRSYRYAVELRSGAFTAAGIHEGDRVVPQDPSILPAPS